MQPTAPQEDITNVDLDGVLPSATIMVVSVTASTTAGQPLPDAEIEQVRPAAVASTAQGLQSERPQPPWDVVFDHGVPRPNPECIHPPANPDSTHFPGQCMQSGSASARHDQALWTAH